MIHPRVVPVNKSGVLEAFAKLLAPRPVVYVFRSLQGWQYAAAEMPETYQVILGVSHELWHYIENSVYEATGQKVADRVEVRWVHEGSRMHLQLAPGPSVAMVAENSPELYEPPRALEIAPKPIANPGGAA